MKPKPFTPAVCPVCQTPMVRTSERYQTCPEGHTGLMLIPGYRPVKAQKEDAEFQRRLDEAIPPVKKKRGRR